jgi:hypothetical protein
MKRAGIALLSVICLTLAACTSETGPWGEPSSTSPATTPIDTGIEGTLTDVSTEAEDGLLEGQILVWATSSEEQTETSGVTLFGRPSAAVLVVGGKFVVELDPGWYLVRGTAGGGKVCDEFTVEVKLHELTRADFACD